MHSGRGPSELDAHINRLPSELAAGATGLFGAHDGDRLLGAIGLEVDRHRGPARDMLDLSPMWDDASHTPRGIDGSLLELALLRARALPVDATAPCVSATPSSSTMHFYLQAGCCLLEVAETVLFEEERDDIRLGSAVTKDMTIRQVPSSQTARARS